MVFVVKAVLINGIITVDVLCVYQLQGMWSPGLKIYAKVPKRCYSVAAIRSVTVDELMEENKDGVFSLNGWVKKIRKSKNMMFLHLSDGQSAQNVQIVVPKNVCESAPVGSAVMIAGNWIKSSGAKQNRELLASQCTVMAIDREPRVGTNPDHLRNNLHLRTRSDQFSALLRLRSKITMETHRFFLERGYVHIDTPSFTSSDCEGAGQTFSVKTGETSAEEFFGNNIGLTVSGQLHLEAATCGIPKVYTLSNGYRAEKQQSSTHLTEFKMLEAEVAFMQNLDDLCDLVGNFVKSTVTAVCEDPTLRNDMKSLGHFSTEKHVEMLESIVSLSSFPRIPYSEAMNLLQEKQQKLNTNGLSKQNEAFLVEYFKSPVFITHFPSTQKPFYVLRSGDSEELTESFDLLCPIVGELAGGSVREQSVQKLRERACPVEWYTELRERGKPISSGFGVGFERLMQMVKAKSRFYLVEMLPNQEKRDVSNVYPGWIFDELMKLVVEMHGDFGYGAVRSRLQVKLVDVDIVLIRVESSAEHFLASSIPFVTNVSGVPLVLRTIFVGRSVRSCEKCLIKYRRKELVGMFGKAETPAKKKDILEAINKVVAAD